MKNQSGLPATWLATAVLLLMFALALTSLTQKSPTFDEQGFIVRGLAYLRGEHQHIRVGHPLGLNALNAALLVADEGVRLPTDDPAWQKTNFHRPAELFLWEIGNDVAKIMFLARLPTVWLGLLLAALAGRWTWALSGRRRAGLLALSLLAFDPNVLAHTRLATTDLGLALGALLAGFTLWRFFWRPSWGAAVLAGVGFGLLQDTKFTAGLFVPLFALVIVVGLAAEWWRGGRFSAKILLPLLVAYPAAAFLTLWAAYGFQIGVMPDNLPAFSRLSGLTLPLSHHLEQLLDIGGRLQKETPSFLLGHYSDSGWWYYFPVAFLLKTPIPTLLLLLLAFWRQVGNRKRPVSHSPFNIHHSFLLIPALGYFAIALTTDINLGYRHLLPVLPLLVIFAASQFSIPHSPFFLFLPLVLLSVTLWIHPDYLAYFNVLAGGPDNGWRALVDSNLDWGQDLAGLKAWMDDNGVERVWLSYFGEARPDYYGIAYDGLDSFPPRLMNPAARPFYPPNPAPGLYAISATNLQGVQFADHEEFAWFRARKPAAKIGYSIFLYDVPASGPPLDVALGGVQLDEIAPADFALWGTNDVQPRWFDASQSFLWPEAGGWLVLAANTAVSPAFVPFMDAVQPVATAGDYRFYKTPPAEPAVEPALAQFREGAGQIALVEAVVAGETAVPGATLTLLTRWQKQSPPQPVKLFVHLTGDNGAPVAQWDGLGPAWEGWRDGDVLWQLSILYLPPDLPPGDYQLWLGLYHPQTGERWQTAVGDRLFIATVAIPGGRGE